jgi:hypothetical protein
MVAAAGAAERCTANTRTGMAIFPRRVQRIWSLRFAVVLVIAVGATVAVASCSSPPPKAQGHPASLPSVPAPAASASRIPSSSPSAAAESMCSFVVGSVATCASANPQVKVYANFVTATSGCTYVRDITWGDGTSSSNIVIPGGPAGHKFVHSHTYSAPGTYTIFFGGTVKGNCTIRTPTFQFDFLSS